ncbi:MAG: ASPIC/UnbV domain-containing protein [Planctomycetaceae bacterium]
MHFGLGTLQGSLQLTVSWPAGTEQSFEIPAQQQTVQIVEGLGLVQGN